MHFQQQGQAGGIIQVVLVGGPGHDHGGNAQHQSLPGEQVDQRQHAALRQHGEGDQQQQCGEQVDELAGQVHAMLSSSRKWMSMPSTASRKAVPRNSGTRKMRILADTRFQQGQAETRRGQLERTAAASASGSAPQFAGLGDAPGQEQGDADGDVGEQLDARWPIRSGPGGAPSIPGSWPRGSWSVRGGWTDCPPGCAHFPPAAP